MVSHRSLSRSKPEMSLPMPMHQTCMHSPLESISCPWKKECPDVMSVKEMYSSSTRTTPLWLRLGLQLSGSPALRLYGSPALRPSSSGYRAVPVRFRLSGFGSGAGAGARSGAKTKRKWPAVPHGTSTKWKIPTTGRSWHAPPSRRRRRGTRPAVPRAARIKRKTPAAGRSRRAPPS